MKINKEEYLDKLRGCFTGKNIGGTMGGPYEGTREILDIKGYKTEKGEPLPNDDLDLQLVWLAALEDQGPQHIDSEMLGEYWQSFITPYWSEYGISKINMQRGFPPSVAGDMPNNIWKHSNGAWIRTEIWATLAPGAIDTAVRYSIEDALVDHGTGEGTEAARFVAALESAAFFVNDPDTLIDIGLAKIDPKSRIHQTIDLVRKEYAKGTDYRDVRNQIVELNKDIGNGWFQAPNNIAFVVIGLLYGEGDFKKSMITAINCGDDTDCTGATIGSILGIMKGDKALPKDWKEYIGPRIITCSINKGLSFRFPLTIDDLVNRVYKQVQYLLNSNYEKIEIVDGETEICPDFIANAKKPFALKDERDAIRDLVYSYKPNTFKVRCGAVTLVVTYDDGPMAKTGEDKHLSMMVVNNIKAFGNLGQTVSLEIITPENYVCEEAFKELYAPGWTAMTPLAYSESTTFTLKVLPAEDTVETILVKVSLPLRGKEYFIPIKFMR